jgi:putative PIN family toxin of toxin-antitoxin system
MKVVIDTNVLVSALWSRNNRLSQIISAVINDKLVACYNADIMAEYQDVLSRPKLAFHFEKSRVDEIINKIKIDGISVAVKPSSIPLPDESDRVFYDVAKVCEAYLITKNLQDFPSETFIIPPDQILYLIDD